jgi:hypothetical protein
MYYQQGGKMDTRSYTTTDIIRGLGIPRERLRDWISRGFVRASVPAPGQGLAAEFSLWDVYRIELFRNLVDGGFDRKVASEFLKVLRSDENEKWKTAYIIFRREGEEIIPMTIAKGANWSLDLKGGRIGVTGSPAYVDVRQLRNTKFDPTAWDNIYLVNFEKIRESVDRNLSKQR